MKRRRLKGVYLAREAGYVLQNTSTKLWELCRKDPQSSEACLEEVGKAMGLAAVRIQRALRKARDPE